MRTVKVAEARRQIGEHVSTSIVNLFTRQIADGRFRSGQSTAGDPAYDPSSVPPVPLTVVEQRPAHSDTARSIFTWKAESGHPPFLIYYVTSRWLTRVARPGYAVLGGYPVLEITTTTDDGRPHLIKAVQLSGTFDSLHGWRAWSTDVRCAVTWNGDSAVVKPVEINGDHGEVDLM